MHLYYISINWFFVIWSSHISFVFNCYVQMCLKVEIVVITFQVLFLVTTFCRQDDHYFESDFDPNQNCKNKTLIDKLEKIILPNSKHEKPERCVSTTGVFLPNLVFYLKWFLLQGSDAVSWEQCKMKLNRLLVQKCSGRNILKVLCQQVKLLKCTTNFSEAHVQ